MKQGTNRVPMAAKRAAELYLERETARTLSQCIAIASHEHETEWKQVAAYLSGVGARALLKLRDLEAAIQTAQEALGQVASYVESCPDYLHYDTPLTHNPIHVGAIWDADDAYSLLTSTLEEMEEVA